MISNFISSSEDETIQIGKDFSSQLISGDIVELIGDLGTGKTHFVKGVSLGIGVKKSAERFFFRHEIERFIPIRVTTPTYLYKESQLKS